MFAADDLSAVSEQSNKVDDILQQIMIQAEQLLPKIEDVEADQLVDLVEQEMQMTSEAIEKAAARIADMLANSREAQSGIQLEVNESILDSCTSLMLAIKILIQKAKVLQQEIAEQGRGTSSAREFYKKHHRWTEGLISAAKAVGWGANVLVEAADKVVKGDGKFEELIVCSQEIAASTVQLVVSSKVKSGKGSSKLTQLSAASKGVSEATGQVVASAKSGAQKIEDLDTLDFSNITLHQAKLQEMESQVRLLQLESEVERERVRLAALRKTHYQLAGESEGWDQEDIGDESGSPTSKMPTT